ncbi:DUF6448 family protein [Bacillus andreraoultii]|uniref:DUF6448 family protein n=1 Tax=Bacillus andreraoultii TaxID=1499685 RepID=UPI0005A7552C|nr:DUF6448 family protein [Bacillus andreraoultii]
MKGKFSKITGTLLISLGIIGLIPTMASAHCDTMDGPVITDAKKAIETNNISYISKWVLPEDEEELSNIYKQTMEVRELSPEAQTLADQYLYENLVRIHRAGEGAPFTGVKPEGTPFAPEIVAADTSIEVENLDPFNGVIDEEKMPEIEEAFEQVLATKEFDVNDVDAGREYVNSYVVFTHLAEGEEAHADGHDGIEEAHESTEFTNENHSAAELADGLIEVENEESGSSSNWIPWTLTIIFAITTVHLLFSKKHKHHHHH